jgi:AcrR family transcriptional regulator
MSRSFHHGDLRNALIRSAEKLIERKGVDSFSLREAARNVGVSANAAYHHFEDKAALLEAVAAHGFARFATMREKKFEGTNDGWDRLLIGAKTYLEFAEAHPALFDLMFSSVGVSSRRFVVERQGSGGRSSLQQLTDNLDALVASGDLMANRREGAEVVLWPMIHGLAVLQRSGALRDPSNTVWKRFVRFVAAGLGLELVPNDEHPDGGTLVRSALSKKA